MADFRTFTIPTGRMDGRSYLLADDAGNAVVIDPDINVDRILETLRAEHAAPRYILLTHCHYDHVSTADALREATGAKTAIHHLDVPGLFDPWLNMSEQSDQPPIQGREIDVELEDGSEITAGAIRLSVLHTPGHTPGSCCFLSGQVLFTGDTLFRGAYGYTGFPGGDMAALIASTKRLFRMDDAIAIYPGHGEASTIGQERLSNPINQ